MFDGVHMIKTHQLTDKKPLILIFNSAVRDAVTAQVRGTPSDVTVVENAADLQVIADAVDEAL